MSILITVSCFMFFVFFCHTKAFSSENPVTEILLPENNSKKGMSDEVQAEFLNNLEKYSTAKNNTKQDQKNDISVTGCIR